eukprot:g3420.t1
MASRLAFPIRVGLIGYGAIGSVVANAVIDSTHGLNKTRIKLVAVLIKNARSKDIVESFSKNDVLLTTSANDFFNTKFDVCVEAAGQSAVREHGEACLLGGRNFLCTSIGALTNDTVLSKLTKAALEGNSQLQLASGAMPGLDWMGASALEPGSTVVATQTKPPESWKNARFKPNTTEQLEDVHDYDSITKPEIVFDGPAREAASFYPKNSNILAMLALTTSGLDKTNVRMVADPIDKSMRQSIEYNGSAGKIELNVWGKKSKTNPKTSQVVPLAVIKALKNMSSPIAFGV